MSRQLRRWLIGATPLFALAALCFVSWLVMVTPWAGPVLAATLLIGGPWALGYLLQGVDKAIRGED